MINCSCQDTRYFARVHWNTFPRWKQDSAYVILNRRLRKILDVSSKHSLTNSKYAAAYCQENKHLRGVKPSRIMTQDAKLNLIRGLILQSETRPFIKCRPRLQLYQPLQTAPPQTLFYQSRYCGESASFRRLLSINQYHGITYALCEVVFQPLKRHSAWIRKLSTRLSFYTPIQLATPGETLSTSWSYHPASGFNVSQPITVISSLPQ